MTAETLRTRKPLRNSGPAPEERGLALRRNVHWLTLIYLASGACSLIDEVVWVRLLKLTLGNTVYATSVVVSVFLGGLALGALVMGRRADRVRNPLRLYALIETLITAAALAVPLALRLADRFYVWFYRAASPPPGRLLLVQVLVSAAIVLAPTILMGSTLPLLGSYVARLGGAVGHRVGRLYAFNTLGAAAGTFLAGFVLLRFAGVWGTLYAAAGLNLLVALGGWALSLERAPERCAAPQDETAAAPGIPVAVSVHGRKRFFVASLLRMTGNRRFCHSERHSTGSCRPELVEGRSEESPQPLCASREQLPVTDRGRRALLLAACFASGFVSIGYEIVWMRSIVHLIGADTYVFSSVLTVYLVGNVLGAWVGSRLAKTLANNAAGFATTLVLLGLSGLLFLPALVLWQGTVLARLDLWLGRVYAASPALFATGYPLATSAALFFVPALLMGLGFPMALEAWHRRHHGPGHSTGTVYGANTIGSVVSGLAVGFLLLPGLGVQGAMTALGLTGAALGAALLLAFVRRPTVRWVAAAAVVLLAAALLAAVPAGLFRNRLIKYLDTELVAVREGVTTTVSVHREKGGALWLCTSGMQVAGDRSRGVQRMLGHLGMLLHPRAKSVLSVGFGTGETTRCLAMHDLERLDCVEISPELVAVALEYFRHINLGDHLADKVNLIFMDAKNYLHLTAQTYDLIITDSINPKYFAENASLYTREYFESAREHLRPGGLVVCWTPFNLPVSCFDSILGTFMDVFPHTSLWFPTSLTDHFVLLVGSPEPALFSPKDLERTLARPAVRESLAGIGIRDPFDAFSCYLGDENDLRRHLASYRPNTDFTPFVEFSPDKFLDDVEKWAFFARLRAAVRTNSLPRHLDWAGVEPAATAAFVADLELRYRINTHLLKTHAAAEGKAWRPDTAFTPAETDELLRDLDAYLPRHDSFAQGHAIRGALRAARSQPEAALADFDAAIRIDPADAFAIKNRAALYAALGRTDAALADYARAIALEPAKPDAYHHRGSLYAALRRLPEAAADLSRAIELDPNDDASWNNRGSVYYDQDKLDDAIADYSRAIKLNLRNTSAWNNRGLARADKGDLAAAVADYTEAVRLEPKRADTYYNRGTAFFQRGEFTAAADDYSRAIELRPGDASYYAARAAALFENKDYRRAWDDVTRCEAAGARIDPQFRARLLEALKQ